LNTCRANVQGASEGRAENSEGETVLECVAHGHAIAVCQIVEAATPVVEMVRCEREIRASSSRWNRTPSQQQISAEQAGNGRVFQYSLLTVTLLPIALALATLIRLVAVRITSGVRSLILI
jgi:hypothetical protein